MRRSASVVNTIDCCVSVWVLATSVPAGMTIGICWG